MLKGRSWDQISPLTTKTHELGGKNMCCSPTTEKSARGPVAILYRDQRVARAPSARNWTCHMDVQRNLSIKKKKDVVDIISELPDNLKENILDRLPIIDAVRTSILSSKWRYIWTERKRLDFDNAFVSLIGKCTGEKYARIIDRILFLHHGPIEHVSLHIPEGVRNDMIDLNAWLLNWSRKAIQELDIYVVKHAHPGRLYFPLPSCLFQCQSLRFLKLSCCELIPPPDFGGFFSLVTLHLFGVIVSSHSLGIVISRCKQLETLYFICESIGGCYGAKPLIIKALNLKTLQFWDNTLGTVVLENVPRLSTVSLGPASKRHMPVELYNGHSSVHLLYSLRNIEKLDFVLPLLELFDGDCSESLPTLLPNLSSLRLYYMRISNRGHIAFIFCLLRSAPILKSLHIQIHKKWDPREGVVAGLEGLEAEESKANNLNKLVAINIGLTRSYDSKNYDYEPTLKLIKILLSSCPLLETLYFVPRWMNELDAVNLNQVLKLLRFRRLSSKAEIILDETQSM